MKLSEALMLGSTLGEKLGNCSYDRCLLGVACHALGSRNLSNREAEIRWPWITSLITTRHYCGGMRPQFGFVILTHFCDLVLEGKMSIEFVAEIIREIEPQDEQTEIFGEGPIPEHSLEAVKA